MGYKYEVNAWVYNDDTGYHYEQVYAGQWLVLAIWNMVAKKIGGVGCVKLEWR